MKNKIDLSPIQNKIQAIAFELFREWTKNAGEEFPEFDFTIKDESYLVVNCRESIEGSIRSLYKQKKYKNNTYPLGWDIGFIYGFIQGNLDSHWQFEYISKRQEPYKKLIALKAITGYFELMGVELIKIENIYREMLEAESNLLNLDFEVFEKKLKGKKKLKTKSTENKGQIMAILKNMILAEVLHSGINRKNSFLNDLDEHISKEEVRGLIESNSWLRKE